MSISASVILTRYCLLCKEPYGIIPENISQQHAGLGRPDMLTKMCSISGENFLAVTTHKGGWNGRQDYPYQHDKSHNRN